MQRGWVPGVCLTDGVGVRRDVVWRCRRLMTDQPQSLGAQPAHGSLEANQIGTMFAGGSVPTSWARAKAKRVCDQCSHCQGMRGASRALGE